VDKCGINISEKKLLQSIREISEMEKIAKKFIAF
jgi:hypothetical protein